MVPRGKPLAEPQCERLSARERRRVVAPVTPPTSGRDRCLGRDVLGITDLHMLWGGALSARRHMFDEGQSFENTSASVAAAGELSSPLNPALAEHS